jgi:GT2 family glycosyltransferase
VATTKKFIECLQQQTYRNFQLILVDDGSNDGTAEFVKGQVDDVIVLTGNGNLWWAGALHKAYKHLKAIDARNDDLVWITNDDVIFEPQYFEKLIKDNALSPKKLVVSPGKCLSSEFVELGFAIDWSSLKVNKLTSNHTPDAITTRGLYMHYSTYLSIGPMHPILLPHYLSDLEYTIRARRLGYTLANSNSTSIHVDRSSTGVHKDNSKNIKDFIFNHLFSKKTAFNSFYWGNFVLLACPWEFKVQNFLKIYLQLFKKIVKFIKSTNQIGTITK